MFFLFVVNTNFQPAMHNVRWVHVAWHNFTQTNVKFKATDCKSPHVHIVHYFTCVHVIMVSSKG